MDCLQDQPVVGDFLRQAEVSHHGRAHAALPAHQAVLHGVRGHTHITVTAVYSASVCDCIPFYMAPCASLGVFKQ